MRRIMAFYAPYTGAGKTLAARWMAQGNRPFHVTSFAKPLRMAVSNFVGSPSIRDKEAILPHLGVSFRDMLIAFGAAGRALRPDFWIRLMENNIREYPYCYVVDDLRFPNEYEFLKGRGAKIVKITNPGREVLKSETEGLLEGYDFDAEIVNGKKSPKAYARQLDAMARDLFPEMSQWFTAKG